MHIKRRAFLGLIPAIPFISGAKLPETQNEYDIPCIIDLEELKLRTWIEADDRSKALIFLQDFQGVTTINAGMPICSTKYHIKDGMTVNSIAKDLASKYDVLAFGPGWNNTFRYYGFTMDKFQFELKNRGFIS